MDRSEDQARAQLESILEMVEALDAGGEEAIRAIQEDPLSVEVKSGWHSPEEKDEATEYQILLCTGGPAVRIIGDLDEHGNPETAYIEHQDWFTPWRRFKTTGEESDTLLKYAQQFYFGL